MTNTENAFPLVQQATRYQDIEIEVRYEALEVEPSVEPLGLRRPGFSRMFQP